LWESFYFFFAHCPLPEHVHDVYMKYWADVRLACDYPSPGLYLACAKNYDSRTND